MSVFSVVNAFNAGELSPLLLARPDLEQYSRGCQILENFLPTPYGTAERRPGTQLMWALPPERGTSGRLAGFVFDSSNAYLLLFLSDRLVAFKPGTLAGWHSNCVVASGNNYPWAGLDLDGLAFCQVNDIMCIVHPDAPPYKLARTGNMEFSLEEWPFDHPPMMDQNIDPLRKAQFVPNSGQGYAAGATGYLKSTAGFGDAAFGAAGADWGGRYVELEFRKAQDIWRYSGNTTPEGPVFGAWTFTTHGTWQGTVTLQRKGPDDDQFYDYLTWESNNDFNVAASGDESEEGVIYKITGNGGYNSRLLCPGWRGRLLLRITDTGAGDSEQGFPAVVVRGIAGFTPNMATMRFSLGAFCAEEGYPRAVCLHQERLWMGGAERNPQRLWGSRVNSLGDFQVVGGEDDSGIDLTLAGGGGSQICWMAGKGALLVGTEDEEWALEPGSSGQALTASSLRCARSSVYGSAWPTAWALAEDRMVFAQRDRTRLRGMLYSWEQDGYVAEDLTLLAEHVTRPGVRCLAVQKSPDTVVWVALEDGTLASCTCDSSQRVNGWARHPRAAGEVLSLCVLPTPSGEDRLYLLTLVSGRLAVERMFPRRFPGFGEAVFLDMAVPVYSGTVGDSPEMGFFHETDGEILFHSNTDTNVPPLAVPWPDDVRVGLLTPGLEYAVTWALRGSELRSDSQAADGQSYVSTEGLDFSPIAWSENGVQRQGPQVGWVGLPYASVLSPMPAEMQTQRGLSMLRQKTVCRMLVDTYGSVGGEARADAGKWQPVLPRDAAEAVQLPASEKTEVVVAAPLGGHARRTNVEIRQTLPMPLNVAGLALELSSEGV